MSLWLRKFLPALAIAAVAASATTAQSKIVVATPGFDHPAAQVLKQILPEAYKKLGFDVEFQVFPPERAGRSFDDGAVDAFIFSDATFLDERKGAVKVATPIGSDDIVVFTKRSDIVIKGWDSVAPYTIGYQIGMFPVESHMKGLKTNPAQNPPQAFQMLDAGRSDIVIMPLGVGLIMIKNLGLKGINQLQPALTQVPLYHFLTPAHADLAPKLAAVLADMAKSGRIKAVTDQVLASFK
jgi:polar amino acid transport system substrate-binding protein